MSQERRGSGEKHRVDYRIKCPQVKVVDETGAMLGVMPTYQAQELAKCRGLNLVEVSPMASPPVCKIMDYGKLKYDEKKSKAHHRQQKTKEILLRPGTDEHDFNVKLRHIIEFLKDGDKVHIKVRFRGRAIVHPEEGKKRLIEITSNQDVRAISRIDYGPAMEGRDMNLILSPQKSSPTGRTNISPPAVQRLPTSGRFAASAPSVQQISRSEADAHAGTRTGRIDTSVVNTSNAPKPEAK